MRLHGLHDGQLLLTDYRTVLTGAAADEARPVGRLPAPTGLSDAVPFHLKSTRRVAPVVERVVGRFPSTNVWRVTPTDLVATAGRLLYTSHDGGRAWTVRHRLPPSSGPMGVLPTGLCVRSGTDDLLLGEYPLDDAATPRILRSTDAGRSWEPLVALPDVRHVHAVQEDPYTGEVWLTTGDRDDESRIARLVGDRVETVGTGDQRWRAVELAFTRDWVLWGMDCAYADENQVLRLDRADLDAARPDPDVVHAVDASVYYSATLAVDGDRWVVFSTAMETGPDSTAPSGRSTDGGTVGRVVGSSAASAFTEWVELASYRKGGGLSERVDLGGRLPRANGYLFLAASADRGVLVNPSNTARDDGRVRRIPPRALAGRPS